MTRTEAQKMVGEAVQMLKDGSPTGPLGTIIKVSWTANGGRLFYTIAWNTDGFPVTTTYAKLVTVI